MGAGSSKEEGVDAERVDSETDKHRKARGVAKALGALNSEAPEGPSSSGAGDKGPPQGSGRGDMQAGAPVAGPASAPPAGLGPGGPGLGPGGPGLGPGGPGLGPGGPAPGRGPPPGWQPGRGAPMPGRGPPPGWQPGVAWAPQQGPAQAAGPTGGPPMCPWGPPAGPGGPPGMPVQPGPGGPAPTQQAGPPAQLAPMPGRGAPQPGRAPPGQSMPGRGPPVMPGRGPPVQPGRVPSGVAVLAGRGPPMPAPGPPGASAGAPTGPSAAPEALATASPRQVQMTQTIQERLQALDKQLGTMVERGPLPVETDAAKKPAGNLAELRARADHLRAQWEKLEQEKSLRQQRRAEAQRLVDVGSPASPAGVTLPPIAGAHSPGARPLPEQRRAQPRGPPGPALPATSIADYVDRDLEPSTRRNESKRRGGGGAIVDDGVGYEVLHVGKDGRRYDSTGRQQGAAPVPAPARVRRGPKKAKGAEGPGAGPPSAMAANGGGPVREGRVGARDEGREAAARGRSAEGRGARSRVRRASARAAEGAGDAVDVDMKVRADGRVTVQVSTTEGRGDRADARAEQDPSPPRARKAALMHAPSWTLFDRGEREKRRSKPRPDQVQVSQPDEAELERRREWERQKRERRRAREEAEQRRREADEIARREAEETVRAEKSRALEERLRREEELREARKRELEEREKAYRAEIGRIRGRVPLHERLQAELEEEQERERRRLVEELERRRAEMHRYQPAVLIPKLVPEEKRKKAAPVEEVKEQESPGSLKQRARERRAAEEKAREEEARARQEAAAAAERRRAELVGTVRVALVAGRGGYVHLRLGLDGAHPDVSMSREEDFQVPSVPAPEPVRVPSPPRVDDVRDYVSVGSTDTGDLDLVSEGDAEGDGLDTDSDLGDEWREVEEAIHRKITSMRRELKVMVERELTRKGLSTASDDAGGADQSDNGVGGWGADGLVSDEPGSPKGVPSLAAGAAMGSGEALGAMALLARRASSSGAYRPSRLSSSSRSGAEWRVNSIGRDAPGSAAATAPAAPAAPAIQVDSSAVRMQRLRSSSFRLDRSGPEPGALPTTSGRVPEKLTSIRSGVPESFVSPPTCTSSGVGGGAGEAPLEPPGDGAWGRMDSMALVREVEEDLDYDGGGAGDGEVGELSEELEGPGQGGVGGHARRPVAAARA